MSDFMALSTLELARAWLGAREHDAETAEMMRQDLLARIYPAGCDYVLAGLLLEHHPMANQLPEPCGQWNESSALFDESEIDAALKLARDLHALEVDFELSTGDPQYPLRDRGIRVDVTGGAPSTSLPAPACIRDVAEVYREAITIRPTVYTLSVEGEDIVYPAPPSWSVSEEEDGARLMYPPGILGSPPWLGWVP